MTKAISGTKEWSVASINCLTGCSHDCRYCYARANAMRFGRTTIEQWRVPRLRPAEITKRRKKVDGRVMFPTTHDILPEFLGECTTVLRKLLEAGNEVLVVSKPHLACIMALCDDLRDWRHQVLFRFTIGSCDDDVLSYWEPGAPAYLERVEALEFAFCNGFLTSVSCEPLLGGSPAVLFGALVPWVTDTIWIGKMNQIRQRVVRGTSEEAIAAVERIQTDAAIHRTYEALKDEPQVRWKDSYKGVLGLELVDKPGADS